jgi:LmbE family N-acetylglucosaminyl deacetylase
MALKLLCVLAHPDDESLALGGTLARYAAEGVETHLVTATRGEHGWMGSEADDPGPQALGRIREAELLAAAAALGCQAVHFLDYEDGQLDQADPNEATTKIANHIRAIEPQVVVTFGPDGVYGHPDHIAISQLTTAACMLAADSFRVSKLYYLGETQAVIDIYEGVFGQLTMEVDGMIRQSVAWPDWMLATHIDTLGYEDRAWQAVVCHQSQMPAYGKLAQVSDEQRRVLWGRRQYYRAYSLVASRGGRGIERDLFAGLR